MKYIWESWILKGGAILFCGVMAASVGDYRLIKTYKLVGEGGWDSITLDSSDRRLYLSHTNQVHVVDADRGVLLGNIDGLQLAHGTVILKEFNRGYVSDGGADKVVIFSLQSLKTIAEVNTGGNPDCILYDPSSRHIFTFNGRTHDATVIDPATGSVMSTLTLGGRPEYAVADGKGGIFVNIRDTNEVAVVDTKTLVVKTRWPIAPAAMPTALAMDKEHRLLFVGGRNKILTILNADTGKIVQVFPIDEGVDTCIYDPRGHKVFVSNRQGTIRIFREDSADSFRVVQTVTTQPGAHTLAFDPTTNNLFLDTADFDSEKIPDNASKTGPQVFDHSKGGFHSMGTVRPGTFRLLVYGR